MRRSWWVVVPAAVAAVWLVGGPGASPRSTPRAASWSAPALPNTTGGIHLMSHEHLYRLLPVPSTRYLPNLATARLWARTHDILSGEWRSGSASVGPNGLFTYPDGTSAEGDMVAANPNLILTLYFNGTAIEAGFKPPYFPAAWYTTTRPNRFGTYDANLLTTVPFSSGPPYGITAAGWRDWVGAYSNWLLANGPRGAGGLDPGGGYYTGIYLDSMHLPATPVAASNAIADLWHVHNPGAVLVTNSLSDGATYFGGARGTLGHGNLANMEYFLVQPSPGGAVFPGDARWRADVSALIDAQMRGTAVQTMTKLWDNRLTKARVEQWRQLTAASYLIANRGKLFMELSVFGGIESWAQPLSGVPWQAAWRFWSETPANYPIYAAQVGASIDPADAAAGSNGTANAAAVYRRGGVYQRRFAHGMAIVNTGSAAVSVRLDGRSYVNAETGAPVAGSLTVPAHSGRVLVLR